MTPSLFPPRHPSDREARLCFQNTNIVHPGLGGPEQQRKGGFRQSTGELLSAMGAGMPESIRKNIIDPISGVIDPQNENVRLTRMNLNNPQKWLTAFQNVPPDYFDAAGSIANAGVLPTGFNRSLEPQDILPTIPRELRPAQFFQFVRTYVPPGVLRSRPEFHDPTGRTHRGFAVNDLTTMDAAGLRSGFPDAAQRTRILNAVAIVLGIQAPANPAEQSLAEQAFEELYPQNQIVTGPIYRDYRDAVEILRQRIPGITNDNIRSIDFLLQHRALLPPSRFFGWLRTLENANDAVRKQGLLRLHGLWGQLETDRLHENAITLKTNTEYEKLNKGVREDAIRLNRTAMQNLDLMRRQNPMLFYGVLALGAYMVYRAWNQENTYLRWGSRLLISAPILSYLYLRVFRGDQNAMNTLLTATDEYVLRPAGNALSGLFGRVVTPVPEQDLKRLFTLGRFLDQRIMPSAVLGLTCAEVPLHLLIDPTVVELDSATGRINFDFTFREGSTLAHTMDGIANRRGYDRKVMRDMLANEHMRAGLSKGIAGVFFNLAARKPEHGPLARRVNQAIEKTMHHTPGGPSIFDPNLLDHQNKQYYVQLVRAGKQIALREHANESLVDMMGNLLRERQLQNERPDIAETVDVPGTGANVTRGPERLLYTTLRDQPLLPERKNSIALIQTDFTDWLAFCSRPEFQILDAGAVNGLRLYAEGICKNDANTPSQISLLFERIRYAVLISVAARGAGRPLSNTDIGEMLGTLETSRPIPDVISSVGNWVNRVLPTSLGSGNFPTVNTLQNVETLLGGTFFRDINGSPTGLAQLREQVVRHRQRFNTLRNPGQAAILFIDTLNTTTEGQNAIRRLGGRTPALEFFTRLAASNQLQYQRMVNEAEQYYAQRVVNDLAIAQMTNHRRNGNHVLEANSALWFISFTEVQNLLRSNEFLFEHIMGTAANPLRGMWMGMMMRELLTNFPFTVNTTTEANRMTAVQNVRQVATLYIALQQLQASPTTIMIPAIPLPFGAGVPTTVTADRIDTELRARVRLVARAFLNQWNPQNLMKPIQETQKEIARVQEIEAKQKKEVAQLENREKILQDGITKTTLLITPMNFAAQMQLAKQQADLVGVQRELGTARISVQNAAGQMKTRNSTLQKQQKELQDHHEELVKSESFGRGIPDLVATMRLLDIPVDTEFQPMLKMAGQYNPLFDNWFVRNALNPLGGTGYFTGFPHGWVR